MTIFTLEGDDLSACAPNVRVNIERLPQVIDGGGTRHCTDIEEYTDIRLENRAESVEEPPMRVDLLLVLFL